MQMNTFTTKYHVLASQDAFGTGPVVVRIIGSDKEFEATILQISPYSAQYAFNACLLAPSIAQSSPALSNLSSSAYRAADLFSLRR